MYTVESPNNGHVGDMASVRCRELSVLGDCLNSNYMLGKFNPCHEVCPL